MKTFVGIALLVVFALAGGYAWAAPPVVSNVTARQRTDGSKIVDIYYDLSDPDSSRLSVSIEVSDDGGSTYNVAAPSVSGDIGSSVPRGTGCLPQLSGSLPDSM